MKDIFPSFVIDRFSRIWLELLVPAAAIMLFVSPLVAQGRRSGAFDEALSYTLALGSLRYVPSANTEFRMVAIRFDRNTSRWMRFETAASFSRPDVQTDAGGVYDPSAPTEKTNLLTVTVGAQVQWQFGRLQPYGDVAFGIFARRDGDADGRRFSRTAFAFPFGVRVKVTDRFGLRGEVRFREDGHEVVTHSNREMTVGLSWTR